MNVDFFTLLAILIGIIGVVMSFITFLRKKKAEKKLENLIRQEKIEIVSMNLLTENIDNKKNSETVLTQSELDRIQEKLKQLAEMLEETEKKEIIESLEQKSTKGQLDYINKMMHLSGSTQNIIVKNDKIIDANKW